MPAVLELSHVPVLLEESIAALRIGMARSVVDGTFGGRRPHLRSILERHPTARVVAIDRDEGGDRPRRGDATGFR
jgi:16S rRNA C1402 N4-methylase RsmH